MSNIRNPNQRVIDLLNPLKNMKDFKGRAARFSKDEAEAFKGAIEARRLVQRLEKEYENSLSIAKHFRDESGRERKNREQILERLQTERDRYRETIGDAAKHNTRLAQLERRAIESFGSVPHYYSVP